jgi:hypothetical protein
MPDYTDYEWPGNWHMGSGGAGGLLHQGGYYSHFYYRELPGTNQWVQRYLEARVDTEGMPPERHVLEVGYTQSDAIEATRVKDLTYRDVPVEVPDSKAAQEDAEQEIHDIAWRVMDEYKDWTP